MIMSKGGCGCGRHGTIDLWKKKLPSFDGDVIDAKYAILHGQSHTPSQASAWKEVEALIAEFKNADKYVISLPMWNFGIPYKLKHYIDILVQPGYTFQVSEKGYEGLIKGKKMLVIYSRGGAYGAEGGAQKLDMQKSYMDTVLPFIGFTHPLSIVIEPTLEGEEKKDQALRKTNDQALKTAAQF